jgi:hypothetical protein
MLITRSVRIRPMAGISGFESSLESAARVGVEEDLVVR